MESESSLEKKHPSSPLMLGETKHEVEGGREGGINDEADSVSNCLAAGLLDALSLPLSAKGRSKMR